MLNSIKNIFKKNDDTKTDDEIKLQAANDNIANAKVVTTNAANDNNDENDKKTSTGFFSGVKNKMLVTMLKSQLAKMPLPAEQKKIFEKILDHKPELIFTIATEIQAEMAKGKGQMQAAQSVMMKYQNELKSVVQG